MSAVILASVDPDEDGMRLDRWFKSHYPQLTHIALQKLLRGGQVRVNGGRAKSDTRLEPHWVIRVPPMPEPRVLGEDGYGEDYKINHDHPDAQFLRSIILYEDDAMYIFNKPAGLAVQGGIGMHRHVDGMLEALRDRKGQKPRLVHRLDRETAGCLIVAKTRLAAATLSKTFRSRSARKIYWALVANVPRVKQGRISTYIAKGTGPDGQDRMMVAKHGAEGADHALTYYAVVETSGQKLAWVSFKPVTGRTHQLRVHASHINHSIVGDPKYFDKENWELPGGIQDRLHLLARRIMIPHPVTGKIIDVSAPLPQHMQQSWNLLGFDVKNYDPIEEAPEK